MTAVPLDRSARVIQIPLPADVRALCTLDRLDYADAFVVDAGVERSAERWARAVLEEAPLVMRAQLLTGWAALGLALAPLDGARILGWRIVRRDYHVVLLDGGSRLGLGGQLVFEWRPGGMVFATFVGLRGPAARAAWTAMTELHRRTVMRLLAAAAERERARDLSAAV